MASVDRLPVLDFADASWRSHFVLTRDALTASERNDLATRAHSGVLTRVRRGVYRTPTDAPYPEDRLRDTVRGHHLLDPNALFSHRSAAALWRLPRLGEWPDDVEILTGVHSGGRSSPGILRHRESVPASFLEIEGIRVTSLVRTAVDVARIDSFASAIATLDAAMRGIRSTDGEEFRATREALLATLDQLLTFRGAARARTAIEFADGRAERAGESLSRVQIARLGLTMPELQVPFQDEEGLMEPDFFWPEYGVAGEFDGYGKYLARHPDPGISVAEAVMQEKHREDRLRRLPEVRTVVRWGWRTANDRPTFARLLTRAGIH